MIAEGILNRLVERLAVALAPPAQPLRPWIVEGHVVGELDTWRVESLARFTDVFKVATDAIRFIPALNTPELRTRALESVVRTLAAEDALTRWRDERYVVSGSLDATPLCHIERAAARFFGIRTCAAHLNGTTQLEGATTMWIARRSADKAIDPGQLDNLVGGGVPAGAGIAATLVREAWEEAGIPPELATRARAVGTLEIRRAQPEGLQRDTIHVHDLDLPAGFIPANQDGEVMEFLRVTPGELAVLAGNADGAEVVTADASLVIADWLLRNAHVPVDSPARIRIARLCRGESP